MADEALVSLPATSAPDPLDLLYVVTAHSGAPLDRQATIADVQKADGLTGMLKATAGVRAQAIDGVDYYSPGSLPASSGGSLIGVQRITATGAYTYTPTVGTTSIIVELQGAGGGGGGVASPTGTNWYCAAGGGGGAWLRKRLTANFSGATGSVGAKGTGGAAGTNDGTAGGNTTFTDTAGSPTTYTAGGGAGGQRGGPFPVIVGPVAAGGTATTGDDIRNGSGGSTPFSLNTNNSGGGSGGSSMYSPGAPDNVLFGPNTTVAGVAATGKGGGGSGAKAEGTGAAAAGGNGSDGVVIIWEYR